MKAITKFYAGQVKDADMACARSRERKIQVGETDGYGSEDLDDATQILLYRTAILAMALAYYETALVGYEQIGAGWSQDRLVAHAYEAVRGPETVLA